MLLMGSFNRISAMLGSLPDTVPAPSDRGISHQHVQPPTQHPIADSVGGFNLYTQGYAPEVCEETGGMG